MYRPKFCAECGEKIVRTRWYPWTSRRFCRYCVSGPASGQLLRAVGAVVVLAGLGVWIGHSIRKPPPPLVMYTRQAAQPGPSPGLVVPISQKAPASPSLSLESAKSHDVVYICGARTKSGKACTRRERSGERCWQHKG